ncbi:MAG: 30S ribosomal protein S20 [Candidatus Eremiobacteraeota bacterium]|nr:30S ribosomal protein S20 [Candidatus Eremiobacteraeota bacterium]
MPNIKAAEKWSRQTTKRRVRNLDTKTRLKTLFKKAKADGDTAFGRGVESQLDKAASKGIIHKNKAARKKSRLAKALAVSTATSTTAAKPKRATRKTSTKK